MLNLNDVLITNQSHTEQLSLSRWKVGNLAASIVASPSSV